MMRKYDYDWDWIKRRENKNKRLGHRGHEIDPPPSNFISDKYDFSPGSWNETREIYIPSLDMKVGPAIRSLLTNHTARHTKKKQGEPCGDTSCLLLKLQAGLGMEQFDILKQEAEEAGYTPQEYEREYEHMWGVGTEENSMEFMSPEDRRLRKEELMEAREEVEDFYPNIWPD